jgi:mannose-6-phosphate isomerase
LVPAGTIHAIGAGIVIAEIQQRGDATFRLFDYGRRRELHLDASVGAATPGPAPSQVEPERLSEARLVVARSPYFVMEQVDLAAHSYWEINADREVWVLLLEGSAKFDLVQAVPGEAVFAEEQKVRVHTGPAAVKALVAYVGSEPVAGLLQSRNGEAQEALTSHFPELGTVRELKPPALTQARGIHS